MYRKLLRPALPLFHDLLHDLIPELLLDLIDPLEDRRHSIGLVLRHELFAALLLLPGLAGPGLDISAEHEFKYRPYSGLDEETRQASLKDSGLPTRFSSAKARQNSTRITAQIGSIRPNMYTPPCAR